MRRAYYVFGKEKRKRGRVIDRGARVTNVLETFDSSDSLFDTRNDETTRPLPLPPSLSLLSSANSPSSFVTRRALIIAAFVRNSVAPYYERIYGTARYSYVYVNRLVTRSQGELCV